MVLKKTYLMIYHLHSVMMLQPLALFMQDMVIIFSIDVRRLVYYYFLIVPRFTGLANFRRQWKVPHIAQNLLH